MAAICNCFIIPWLPHPPEGEDHRADEQPLPTSSRPSPSYEGIVMNAPENIRGRHPALFTPLPSRYANTGHTYQGLPAWSPDQSQLLYIGFDDPGRCDIVIRDVATGEEQAIAHTDLFDFHTAAWQHWALEGRAVIFRGQNPKSLTPPRLVPVDAPHEAEPVSGLTCCLIRQVIENGRIAVYYRWPHGDIKAEAGFYDLVSGEARILFRAEEAVRSIVQGTPPDASAIDFSHVVANADSTRVFFKIMEKDPKSGTFRFRSFHAFHLPTGKFTDFGSRISGHPAWLDDRRIVNVMHPRDGSENRWLVVMDTETGEVRRLHDAPIEGPGHPALSPDGRWLVTDAFTADGQWSILYLLDLHTDLFREIGRFEHRTKSEAIYNPRVVTRAHPHPTWSPDSKKLLANCNFGGSRLGLILWERGDGV